MSRRMCGLLLLGLTLPAGLIWRMAPLGLPPFAFKYGGSALWAIAVYWTIGALRPQWSVQKLGGAAGLVALCVELGKLLYWAPLDRFRETLAGKLLLGRYFSVGAIAAYWVAIGAVMLLDWRFLQRRTQAL